MTAPPSQLTKALRDRYALERELGRGGMAVVYLARDLRHDRLVALKVLHPELAHSLGPDRFLREIRTTARLQHPHILPVLDSGEAAGQLWYTMPYVRGESLRDRLRREVQLPVDTALELARQVALALDYASREGVVHRDLKPENILLSDGQALVADFGVAKALSAATGESQLTMTDMAVGTPAYMSPEQASAGSVDGRSDVYALGCVLYELLAGEPPYSGPTPQAVLAKRLLEPVPHVRTLRESVPEAVERVLIRALARAPADRFATAAEFGQALLPGSPTAGPVRGGPSPTALKYGAFTLLGTAALLLAVVLARGHISGREMNAPAAVRNVDSFRRQAPSERPGVVKSVAVLPLVNVGGDPEQEYFADGMTDELTSALGKVPGLRVAARSSAFAFKGQRVDVQEVGAKLRVATVLEGSVRRAGPRLRVAAQLVNAADGLALWSETYERTLSDVFQVQEDIARAIAGALRLSLGGEQEGRVAGGETTNLEAHDLYLRGRFFLNRGSEPDLRHSLTLFEQALAKDSTYALPWAGLAHAWNWLADDYLPPRQAFPRAKVAARRALAFDSTVAEAHAELGLVLRFFDWDYAAGERELGRAIALNPSDATAHLYWGLVLLSSPSRLDSALAVMRRAESLDPLNPAILANVGWALLFLGRYNEAVAQCKKALELDPQSAFALGYMGEALVLAGRPAEALEVLRRAPDPPARIQADIARALLGLGRRAEAVKVLRAMERDVGQHYALPIASVYVAMGDRDGMLPWLKKASQARSSNVAYLGTEPIWAPVRSDPRFAALMRSLGTW